jgi:hypothetical protein
MKKPPKREATLMLNLERKGLVVRNGMRNGEIVWKTVPGVELWPNGMITKDGVPVRIN